MLSKRNRRYRSRNRPTRIVDGAPNATALGYLPPNAPIPKVTPEEIQKLRMSKTNFREAPDEGIIKHIQQLKIQRMQQRRLQALQQQQRQMMAQQMSGNTSGGMQMMENTGIDPAQMAHFQALQQRYMAAGQQQAPNPQQKALLAAQQRQLIQAQRHRKQQEANRQMAQGQQPNQPGGAGRGRQSLRQLNARSLAGVINKDTISRDNTIGEEALEAKILAVIAKIDGIPQQAKTLQAGHVERGNRDKRVWGNSPSLSPVAVERPWSPPDDRRIRALDTPSQTNDEGLVPLATKGYWAIKEFLGNQRLSPGVEAEWARKLLK